MFRNQDSQVSSSSLRRADSRLARTTSRQTARLGNNFIRFFFAYDSLLVRLPSGSFNLGRLLLHGEDFFAGFALCSL